MTAISDRKSQQQEISQKSARFVEVITDILEMRIETIRNTHRQMQQTDSEGQRKRPGTLPTL